MLKPKKPLLHLEPSAPESFPVGVFSLKYGTVEELPEGIYADTFADFSCEYFEDFDNLCEAMLWFTGVFSEGLLGAYWSKRGEQPVRVFQYWLSQYPLIAPYFPILLSSDCSPGELLLQMHAVLTAVFKEPKKYSHFRPFIYAGVDQEVNRENTDWDSSGADSYNSNLVFLGSNWRGEFLVDYSKRTKDVGSRRQSLRSLYESRPDTFKQIAWVIQDAENLTSSAIKEIVYLSKVLGCPFILLGNEDLEKVVNSAKSEWIDVCPIAGQELDAEFLAQAQDSDAPLGKKLFEFKEAEKLPEAESGGQGGSAARGKKPSARLYYGKF